MSKISIPVAKPWLGSEEVEAASKTILSGWVTQGPQVKAFENEFAAYTGAMCACAVSNCTTALHLALLAVGVKPGDEVITVSHSFIATANAVKYCGAEPVFIDIDPATYNMDPSLIAEAATERTSAILCVHQIGMPCDMDAILAVAAELRLPVVEDAACAIGSDIKVGGEWSKVGKAHGDVACFSFHPRKILTTGDGGMLTTNNASMDQQFRLLRQHGMSVPDAVRHDSPKIIFEEYVVLGFNYRMTDIQASIGRVQLGRLDDMITRRREQAAVYTAAIESVFGVSAPHEPEYARSNWQSYCARLDVGVDQVAVMQSLLDDGIASRRGIMCAHREKPYLHKRLSLPESERAQEYGIILPMFHDMTHDQQETVVNGLKKALDKIAP